MVLITSFETNTLDYNSYENLWESQQLIHQNIYKL